MGFTVEFICLTCDSWIETDLDCDAEDLITFMIEHWGHHVKIKHYSREDIEIGKNPT